MLRIVARWRENTSSSASEISPTVARARVASIDSSSRLPSPACALAQRVERVLHAGLVARRHAAARAARAAARARRCCRRRGRRRRAPRSRRYLLTPTMTSSPRSTRGLAARRRLLDAQLRHARLDRLGHAAERLDLLDELPRLVGEARGERLDVVAAAERVDHVGDAGLLGEDQLRVARDARRELGRQRDRLVERVGVQALRAAEHRGHRLDGGAHDVVVRVLLGERHARRLAVRAQHRATPASAARTGG